MDIAQFIVTGKKFLQISGLVQWLGNTIKLQNKKCHKTIKSWLHKHGFFDAFFMVSWSSSLDHANTTLLYFYCKITTF